MVLATKLLPEVRSHYGDLQNYVGGAWRTPQATEWIEDTNPATGRVIARVPLSTKEDVDVAVQEALRAWDAWRETPPLDRARYFFTLRDLMEQHFEDLSRVVVQDMGKTIDEARGEVRRAIENVEVAAGIPSLMMGYNLEDGAGAGIDEEVLYQPLGVFAGISPFNFPVMVQFWFWPYAVATGNCWITKPSEQDPIPMQLVMDLVRQAGFPPGVVNLVHGAKETVNAILDHPRIAGVSFVGSSEVAKLVYAKAAASGKRVQAGDGARVALDGRPIRVSGYDGYFVGPTILDDVRPDMRVAREEIFGPVASVVSVDAFDDAVDLINASPYGNAATIYTTNGKHARDFRYRVRAGNIGINVGVAAPMAYFPFGGMKDSFFGELHPQGRDAIRFFTESKVVITRWP